MLPKPQSKFRFEVVREVAADPAGVFHALTSEAGMKRWAPMCRSATWAHPPHRARPGKDSVRHIALPGGIVAAERILAWEENVGLHYGFDPVPGPLAAVLALTRNYVGVTRLEPLEGGRTRLIWQVCFDAPGLLALTAPVLSLGLHPLIARMAGKLQRLAEQGAV